jgi:hypothetical protein
MRSLFMALALGLPAFAAAAAPAPAPGPAPGTEANYQALLAAAKAGAPNADWGALRLAYSRRPSFRVFAQSAAKRQMFEAAQKGDCAAALPAAKATLEEAYVDIDAHMVAAFCEDAAGDKAAAQLDRDIGAGLAASIETGDGLSTGSAFTPIDVDEEYAVMRALGAHVTEQALIQSGGHSYDALTTVDQAGRKATYYFLIDRVIAAEAAALQPGAVGEGGPPDRGP